jgi:hypothetical protein
MTKTLEPLVPVSRLCDLADWYPRSVLPREASYRSLPMPCNDPKGVRVAFLFGKAEIEEPKDGLRIWPPSHIAYHDPKNGRFLKLRPVTSAEFGLKHPADVPLGLSMTEGQRAAPEFLSWKAAWYQAFDALLPHFLARTVKLPSDAWGMIADFKEVFSRICEPPLLPYYHSVGGEFLAWLYAFDPAKR